MMGWMESQKKFSRCQTFDSLFAWATKLKDLLLCMVTISQYTEGSLPKSLGSNSARSSL